MTETKKVFKWWWPWQTDMVEAYLEKQAGEGWVLAAVGGGCTSFTFERRRAARMRYCLDYQEKDKPDYRVLLEDAGWKMEYHGSGWYLWSMAYDGERPEIYTDTDSLIRRSGAILCSLTAVLAAQIPIGVVILNDLAGKSSFAIGLLILWGVIIAVLAGATISMALSVCKLKRRNVLRLYGEGGSRP